MAALPVMVLVGVSVCAAAGQARDQGPAARYAGEAVTLIEQIEAKMPAITGAAEKIADHMVAGHDLWLGGSYEGFVVEGYYRAGGMMRAQWLKSPTQLKAGDVLLLGTVDEDNPKDASLIEAADARGAMVVRIGPAVASPLASGDTADAPDVDLPVLCQGDRAARAAGRLPLVSAGDAAMLWALTGEVVGALTRLGKMTPMFQSVLVPGGTARNAGHLKLQWEPTCPPAQPAGALGRSYLGHVRHYVRELIATQLPKFAEAGALVAQAKADGEKAYVIPFGHLPPYEVKLSADPDVFEKLPSNTDGKLVAKQAHAGDVIVYIGYYELPRGILEAAHAAGAKVVSFVSGTPEQPAVDMGADVNIDACWPFGDASVKLPGYDVKILPPSGVMTSIGYWMVVAEAQADEAAKR